MTVEELYNAIGGNYAEAKERLMSDSIISKFIVKFLADKSYEELISAYLAGDDKKSFAAAHTLKGVSANLAITSIAVIVHEITEYFRPGREDLRAGTDIGGLIESLKLQYEKCAVLINEFAAQG